MSDHPESPRPGDAPHRNRMDDTTDTCARGCGLILLGTAITGAVLASLSLISCEFLSYPLLTGPLGPSALRDDNTTMVPTGVDTEPNLASAYSLGFFLYEEPEDGICYYYTDTEVSLFKSPMRFARLGAILMVGCSILATFCLLMEFCFCRFWCSRTLIISGFLVAMIGVLLSFSMFADARCRSSTGQVFVCETDQGSHFAILSALFFLLTLILVCVTPKAIPFVRVVQNMRRNKNIDPCACCLHQGCWNRSHRHRRARGGMSKDDYDEDEDDDDDDLELTESSDQVVASDGHTYKQYHDETAGYTSQNQYTAAYKRWLDFEADYEEALRRFKTECTEAEVNWRLFLKKAKARRERAESFLDEPRSMILQVGDANDETDTDEDDDDDMYFDDELLRFVNVLLTLRDNCNFAKKVMGRIQDDITEHTKSEDNQNEELDPKQMAPKDARSRYSRPPPNEEIEFDSMGATIDDMEEAPLLNESISVNDAENGLEAIRLGESQKSDVFESARMEDATSAASSRQMNVYSSDLNSSIMRTNSSGQLNQPSNRAIENGTVHPQDASQRRRPVANFVMGFRTVNWAWDFVQNESEDGNRSKS